MKITRIAEQKIMDSSVYELLLEHQKQNTELLTKLRDTIDTFEKSQKQIARNLEKILDHGTTLSTALGMTKEFIRVNHVK